MTRTERITALENEIYQHKAYGDTVAIDICCQELEELEAMTDEEYERFKSVRDNYASNSVKPIITKEIRNG